MCTSIGRSGRPGRRGTDGGPGRRRGGAAGSRRASSERRAAGSIGKNVPAEQEHRGDPEPEQGAEPLSFFWVAEKAQIGAAKAIPVRTATGIARTPSGEATSPKTTITTKKAVDTSGSRKAIQPSWPRTIPRDGQRGAEHPEVGPVPDDRAHDRPGRLEAAGLHRLAGEEPRRQEGRVGHPAEGGRARSGRRTCPGRCPSRSGRGSATGTSRRASRARLVDRPVTLYSRTRSAGVSGSSATSAGGRHGRLLDQAPAGQPEEDVLEGRPADEDGLGPETPLVDGDRRRLAVVGVEQDPVGQPLDPLGQPVEPAVERRRRRSMTALGKRSSRTSRVE